MDAATEKMIRERIKQRKSVNFDDLVYILRKDNLSYAKFQVRETCELAKHWRI